VQPLTEKCAKLQAEVERLQPLEATCVQLAETGQAQTEAISSLQSEIAALVSTVQAMKAEALADRTAMEAAVQKAADEAAARKSVEEALAVATAMTEPVPPQASAAIAPSNVSSSATPSDGVPLSEESRPRAIADELLLLRSAERKLARSAAVSHSQVIPVSPVAHALFMAQGGGDTAGVSAAGTHGAESWDSDARGDGMVESVVSLLRRSYADAATAVAELAVDTAGDLLTRMSQAAFAANGQPAGQSGDVKGAASTRPQVTFEAEPVPSSSMAPDEATSSLTQHLGGLDASPVRTSTGRGGLALRIRLAQGATCWPAPSAGVRCGGWASGVTDWRATGRTGLAGLRSKLSSEGGGRLLRRARCSRAQNWDGRAQEGR
jgi:hypothetical protein